MHMLTFSHARHYHVPELLHELDTSKMATTIGGFRCMWCNALGQYSARVSIQGAIQSGDGANHPVSGI